MPCLIEQAANALVAAIVDPRCAACEQPLDTPLAGPVCAPCWESVRTVAPQTCGRCGSPLPSWRVMGRELGTCARCRRAPPALDAGAAAGEYEGALRRILHAFKYDGRRSLARPLGALMRRAGGHLLDDADCVVPVPLHPWRRWRRGFNQADDLARELGPRVVQALCRRRATAPQAGLTAAARRRNVEEAFRVVPRRWIRGNRVPVAGRVVVLVDDVRTTGATLDACARVLKTAGAREVRALTAARAALRPGGV